MRESAPANEVAQQIAPSHQNIMGGAAGAAPLTARGVAQTWAWGGATGAVPLTARGPAPLTARGQVPAPAPAHGQVPMTARGRPYVPPTPRQPSPTHEVTRQRSAYVPPTPRQPSPQHDLTRQYPLCVPPTPRREVIRQSSACLPSPRQEVTPHDVTRQQSACPVPRSEVISEVPRTLTQSAKELPTPRSGFDPAPTLTKSPSAKRIAKTRDLLTESLTDSTCSPATPRTPTSSEDELVNQILAQAMAARERASRALETCKDSKESIRPGRRTNRSPVRQHQRTKSSTVVEDLVAGVDLVAATISTPPGVDTPPMRRIAPAFQEPSAPASPVAQNAKGFEALCSMDSIKHLKQGCATPPWPQHLAETTIRPHSYALRDVKSELESLNDDLLRRQAATTVYSYEARTENGISSALKVYDLPEIQEPEKPKTSQTMESFEIWRASLLSTPFTCDRD